MTKKQTEFVNALEGAGWKIGIAYQNVNAGEKHVALVSAVRLLRNPEIRKAIREMIDALPVQTPASKKLYTKVCEREILTEFYANSTF